LEEIIIHEDFLDHQEVANASPSQGDPYLSPCQDFKLIACFVQELWCSKVELKILTQYVAASAGAGLWLSRVLIVKKGFYGILTRFC
jgi:hypothetical protein